MSNTRKGNLSYKKTSTHLSVCEKPPVLTSGYVLIMYCVIIKSTFVFTAWTKDDMYPTTAACECNVWQGDKLLNSYPIYIVSHTSYDLFLQKPKSDSHGAVYLLGATYIRKNRLARETNNLRLNMYLGWLSAPDQDSVTTRKYIRQHVVAFCALDLILLQDRTQLWLL